MIQALKKDTLDRLSLASIHNLQEETKIVLNEGQKYIINRMASLSELYDV